MEMLAGNKWVRICLINLLFVSILGVLMRYKIGFSFPFLDQKNLQHAHSHFAFTGWVSQLLMFLMLRVIAPSISPARIKQYTKILWLNWAAAVGMLFAFAIQGYAFFSISFSTISIIISFIFCSLLYSDLRKNKQEVYSNWFNAAILFNVLSSLGTFVLVYMMATKSLEQHTYLGSVYWYLHFQYNGWFLFACLGLFIHYIKTVVPTININTKVFWLFAISCIPAYGLSVLWANLPQWLYFIVAIAAVAQFYGWILLLIVLKNISFSAIKLPVIGKYLLWFVGIAFCIKISLQLGSVIPSISKLAFGFRPIVIAYLHLALLAVTSVFLITYCFLNGLLKLSRSTNTALLLFITGVFLNELILAIQGIASLSYMVVPFVNILLFVVSILLFLSIMLLVYSQIKDEKQLQI